MARILLGVTGGIAAYKAVEFTRLAIKGGHGVRVVATPTSERFVGKATFEGITGVKVLGSEFDEDPLRGAWPGEQAPNHSPIGHLAIAERAEAFVVAPASANTIAKLAHGICDSLLTTAFCATRAPRTVCPAMNDAMWEDQATVDNVAMLVSRGVRIIEPGHGALASAGEHGVGRLAEPAEILSVVNSELEGLGEVRPRSDLAGKKVLVTAGGTRERLDPVRFLGNRSSGRMGYEIARSAARRGAEVTLISANSTLESPEGVRVIEVESTADLEGACRAEFAGHDMLFMAAAPADFRPRSSNDQKLNRDDGGLVIELEPTEDILASLAAVRRRDQVLVGFAAETGTDGHERALAKLDRKAVDLIVLNDVSDSSIGFDSDHNAVTVLGRSSTQEIGRRPKSEVAEELLDLAFAAAR